VVAPVQINIRRRWVPELRAVGSTLVLLISGIVAHSCLAAAFATTIATSRYIPSVAATDRRSSTTPLTFRSFRYLLWWITFSFPAHSASCPPNHSMVKLYLVCAQRQACNTGYCVHSPSNDVVGVFARAHWLHWHQSKLHSRWMRCLQCHADHLQGWNPIIFVRQRVLAANPFCRRLRSHHHRGDWQPKERVAPSARTDRGLQRFSVRVLHTRPRHGNVLAAARQSIPPFVGTAHLARDRRTVRW
jgi:hypothetical protein